MVLQTLLKEYNSPNFYKTTIRIEDTQSDGESELSDYNDSTKVSAIRAKGVPIKLQLKRQYAEETPSPGTSRLPTQLQCCRPLCEMENRVE